MKYLQNIKKIKWQEHYYLSYTGLFLLLCLLCFIWHMLSGSTFIWDVDGWQQHFKALIYYSRYLKQIINTLIHQHRFIMPMWDFSIGEGSDILQTLHYYVIGDPFTWLSVVIPETGMHIYYGAMIILRLYLSGIVFSKLCFQLKQNNHLAVLSGSLIYVFCYWGMHNAATHPYFLNPMIYLPLIILGIEKILNWERPYLFIGVVMIAALSNFYFFYMLVLMTIIYVACRLIDIYGIDLKNWMKEVGKLFVYSLTGVLMAAIVILPIIYVFTADARNGSSFPFHLFYNFDYYMSIPGLFVAEGFNRWLCMGFGVPALLSLILLFKDKDNHRLLKRYWIIAFVIMVLPILGRIFNGMSYEANRWSFAIALLAGYTVVVTWDRLMHLTADDYKVLFLGICIVFAIAMMSQLTHTAKVFSALVLMAVALMVLSPVDLWPLKTKQHIILALTVVSIGIQGVWKYSVFGDIYIDSMIKTNGINERLSLNETQAIDVLSTYDPSFWRYTGNLTENTNMLSHHSSTQFYWTNANGNVAEFRQALECNESRLFKYKNYDGRVALDALAAVKYDVETSDAYHPYGTHYVNQYSTTIDDEIKNYYIYELDDTLPLTYSYDHIIDRQIWNQYSAIDKEELLLQGAVIDDYQGTLTEAAAITRNYPAAFQYINGQQIVHLSDRFIAKEDNAKITLTFDAQKNCQTYIHIKGLRYEMSDALKAEGQRIRWVNLDFKTSAKNKNTLCYDTAESHYYHDVHDFVVNLTQGDQPIKSVTMSFDTQGIYSYDSIDIIQVPMDELSQQLSALKQETLKNCVIKTNEVSGYITVDQPKILTFAIPYSKGWKAYLDGEEVNLYRTNVMYMGIEVPHGMHNVKLVYQTPLLKTGAMISSISIVLFAFVVLAYELNMRRRH